MPNSLVAGANRLTEKKTRIGFGLCIDEHLNEKYAIRFGAGYAIRRGTETYTRQTFIFASPAEEKISYEYDQQTIDASVRFSRKIVRKHFLVNYGLGISAFRMGETTTDYRSTALQINSQNENDSAYTHAQNIFPVIYAFGPSAQIQCEYRFGKNWSAGIELQQSVYYALTYDYKESIYHNYRREWQGSGYFVLESDHDYSASKPSYKRMILTYPVPIFSLTWHLSN